MGIPPPSSSTQAEECEKVFCKLWSPTQISVLGWKINFTFILLWTLWSWRQTRRSHNPASRFQVGPYKWKPDDISTDHFQIKCQLPMMQPKHHKLTEHKSFSPFSPRMHQGTCWIHVFTLKAYKRPLLSTSWEGSHLLSGGHILELWSFSRLLRVTFAILLHILFFFSLITSRYKAE